MTGKITPLYVVKDHTWIINSKSDIIYPCGKYGSENNIYIDNPFNDNKCYRDVKYLKISIKLTKPGSIFKGDGKEFCVSRDILSRKSDPLSNPKCIPGQFGDDHSVMNFKTHKFFDHYNDGRAFEIKWLENGLTVTLDPKIINGPPRMSDLIINDYIGFLFVSIIWIITAALSWQFIKKAI